MALVASTNKGSNIEYLFIRKLANPEPSQSLITTPMPIMSLILSVAISQFTLKRFKGGDSYFRTKLLDVAFFE